MNANEVISNRAIELLGGDRFSATKPIHPNDHVNMGQSTNDMFPTAIHVAVAQAIQQKLIPALAQLAQRAGRKSPGSGTRSSRSAARTWPTPRRCGWGRRFGGFARQIELSVERAEASAIEAVLELPVGGTAVGTGINTHPEFGRRVAAGLGRSRPASRSSKRPITSKPTPSATGWSNATASCGRSPSTLFNVANNIRWLGSGPRCGFYEVQLPDRQPGSSIMPGKVNPVMCESMMQVAARVMGNDQTVAISGAAGGQFQLNIMMPVMGHDDARKHRTCWPAAPRRSSTSARRRWKPTPKPAKRRSKRACRW